MNSICLIRYLLIATATGLGACGGGGGAETPVTPPTPAVILIAPTISTQPQDQSGLAGMAMTLSVGATGSAPLTYQWQRNGVDIKDANSASYSFQPSWADNESVWTVRVSNAVGTTISTPAVLAVSPQGQMSLVDGDLDWRGKLPDPSNRGTLSSDRQGNIYYYHDTFGAGYQYLKKLSPTGAVTPVPTTKQVMHAGLVVDGSGNMTMITPMYLLGFGSVRSSDIYSPLLLDNETYLVNLTWNGVLFVGSESEISTALSSPVGMVMNSQGAIYVAELNGAIRALNRDGTITTFAKTGQLLRSMTVDQADNIFVAADFVEAQGTDSVYKGGILKITKDGVVSTYARNSGTSLAADGPADRAHFGRINGMALDSRGNLYFADATNHLIRRISTTGFVSTVAGKTGSIENLVGKLPGSLSTPFGLVMAGDDTLFVNTGDAILKVSFPQ